MSDTLGDIVYPLPPSINYFPQREKMWIHHCHLQAPPIIGPSSCKPEKISDCKHPPPLLTPQPGWRAFPIESVCGGHDREVNNTKIFVWNWNYFPKENGSIVLLFNMAITTYSIPIISPSIYTPPSCPQKPLQRCISPLFIKGVLWFFPLRHYETAHSHLKLLPSLILLLFLFLLCWCFGLTISP